MATHLLVFDRATSQGILLLVLVHRSGPSIGHGHILLQKRSNLVGKIMVRSEYKYHTLGLWVFDFAPQDGKGGE